MITESLKNCLIIGAGGFVGAITRYYLALWISRIWGRNFPLGTFVINITGSFLIGLVMALLLERFAAPPFWRLLLVVGFLGAYTTFSTFEYETGGLVQDGEMLLAALYVISSVLAGFIALRSGQMLARIL
jgi:fluoride exporter